MVVLWQPGEAELAGAPSAGSQPAAARPGETEPAIAGRARTRSISRTLAGLLVVPLLALMGLWGFVASTTISNALTEHQDSTLASTTVRADNALLATLDKERLATFLWLSSPVRPPLSQLAASRRADDAAIATYLRTPAENPRATQSLVAQLRAIPEIRSSVDAGKLSAPTAFRMYSGIVDGVFAVYLTAAQSDVSLYQHSLAALDTGRAVEQLGRELALVAGAELAHGRMSTADATLFADSVASQRLLIGDAIALSSGQLHASLLALYGSALHGKLTLLEDQIAGSAANRAALLGALQTWGPVSKGFLGRLTAVENADDRPLVAEAAQVGRKLLLEAGLSGGLGLLAVIAAVFLMIRFGRRIRGELTDLHGGAVAMASERLPRLVARLRGGDDVDVAAESPPLPAGKITEIARVAAAFSSVQRTAVDAAVGQANLRKGVNQVFLNLSLRSQSLLHRQLSLLDTLERVTEDPAALADLFRLDHLTTRMRRHAESLIVLSGATPGRGWRDPVPVVNILRAATAEVEDYLRVDVTGESPDSVVGAVANDVVHLIAELVDNATAFSPPNTRVEIRAEAVGFGVAVEVEDRGFGLSHDDLAEINARLASPPGFDLANSEQLGLFVVGQLAARHGIRVALRESAYGGVTAIVLLPHSLIAGEGEPDPGAGAAGDAGAGAPRARAARADAVGTDGAGRDGVGAEAADRTPAEAAAAGTAPAEAAPEAAAFADGRLRPPDPDGAQPSMRGPWQPPARHDRPGRFFAWAAPQTDGRQEPPAPAPRPADRPEHRSSPPASGDTHLGMPRRVRQANLAPQLRSRTAADRTGAQPGAESLSRSPEQTRSMLSSLQDGWRRGRVADVDSPGGWPAQWPRGAAGAEDADDGEAR